jgi:hypothetical protein
MRHWSLVPTLAVGFLPSAMGAFSSLACLIALACGPNLIAPPATPAWFAAIALPTITVGADGEYSTAAWLTTLAWPKALSMIVRSGHLIKIPGSVMLDNFFPACGAR